MVRYNILFDLILFSFTFLKHSEREFLLKFSAIEIYNESVRDLLGLDNTPLRLLDDSEVTKHVYLSLIFSPSTFIS